MNQRFVIASLLLLAASPAWAASNDVVLNSGAIISAGGVSMNVSGSNSVVESLQVNSSDFVAALPNTSRIEVTSSKKFSWTATANTLSITHDCEGTSAHLTVVNNSGSSVSITVTPTSVECGTSGGSSGGGGGNGPVSGGGGGGGGYIPPVTTPAPTTAMTVTVPGASQTLVTVPVTIGTTYAFTRSLYTGLSGPDVSELQRVLALDPALYPEANVSGYFGALTRAAVERFQLKYGIASSGGQGFGVFGPATRAKFMSVYGAQVGLTPTIEVSGSVSGSLTVTLKRGMTHAQVKLLQQILNKDPETIVSASGVGSAGMETDFFGSMTEKAVQKFQAKYQLVTEGTPATTGYGLVGPKTRAKLNTFFSI